MISHSVNLVCQFVTVDLVLCGIGHIICRNSLVDISPTDESVSLLGWGIRSGNCCSIFHICLWNDLAVCDERNLVLVCNVWTIVGHVMRRNGLIHISETRERVSFLLINSRNYNFRAVSLWLLIDSFTINNELDNVRICRERTCNLYIMRRHRCRNLTPTRESLTVILRCCQWCDGSTESYILAMISHSVNLVCQFVTVDLVLCGIGYIMCRNSLVNIAPANKGMSLLWRGLWSDYRCAVFHFLFGNGLAVSDECHFVLVGDVCSFNCYIVSWHRRWQIFPSRKRISFFFWNLFGYNTTSCR